MKTEKLFQEGITQNPPSLKTSPYPILSPHGRKGQSGEGFQNPTKSSLISGAGRRAFTLVELIIVITILAILATIAFMSFQGYSEQTRDSNRLATLKSIEKGLTIFQTKSGGYPETSSGIKITASGATIGYQGTVGENVVRTINMNQVPLDPVDNSRYVYATNEAKTKYQLMAFMEGVDNLVGYVSPSYAGDLSERTPQSIGDNVGIILEEDNVLPTIDVNTSSGTKNYKVVFNNTDNFVGSGILLSVIQAQRRDKTLAKLDESLVGYWDMETTIQSGSLTMLKDLSKYGNHGTLSGGVNVGGVDGVNGKATYFDGLDDKIYIGTSSQIGLNIGTGAKTFAAWFYKNTSSISNYHKNIVGLNGGSIYGNSFALEHNNDRLFFYGYGSTGYDKFGKSLTDNNIYFAVITFNGSELKMYIDGKIDVVGNITNNIDGNGKVFIGSLNSDSLRQYSGLIDEVRIYNRALSDSEIKALYNATK